MPRAAFVTVEEAVNLLTKYQEHFRTDKFPSFSSKIWVDMSNDCHNKWSSTNLYINVTQNRRGILTTMRKNLGIEIESQQNITLDSTDISDTNHTLNTSDDVSKSYDEDYRKKPNFVLLLEPNIWNSLGPMVRDYERSYVILRPNEWTDIIFDAFYKQFRLPCAYVFKRAKIHPDPSSEFYLKIQGQCKDKDCKNSFIGLVETQPKENSIVELNIYTKDTSNTEHNIVKRPLEGKKRRQIADELLAKGVTGWRKGFARDKMYIGETEPPNLYTASVLRKAKKEKLDHELNVKI